MTFNNHNPSLHKAAIDNIMLKPNDKTDVSAVQTFSLLLHAYLGNGCWMGGKNMSSGLMFTLIVNIAVGMICYYSSWMVQHAAGFFCARSYEGIWKACNFRGSLIISLEIIIPSVGFSAYYLLIINKIFKDLILSLYPNTWKYFYDDYFTSFIVLIIMIPFFFRSNTQFSCACSWLSHILLFITFIINLILVFQGVSEQGFDPNHQVKAFNLKEGWMTAITESISAWTTYNLHFNAFNHMTNYTPQRSKRVLLWVSLFSGIFLQISQYSTYFIMYNKQTDIIYLSLEKNTLVIIAEIACTIKLIFMIPVLLSPAIQAMYEVGSQGKPVNNEFMKFSYSIILFLSAMLFSALTKIYTIIIAAIQNFCAMTMEFLFPAIIFLPVIKSPGQKQFHWFGIVFFFIVGSILAIYTIVNLFITVI